MNKTYAVADLHGQYNLWRQVIEYLDDSDTLYILGDCGDRGPDGWKIIKEALKDPRVIYIRGNHDQFLIDSWQADWRLDGLWYYNGGYETFEAASADQWADEYVGMLSRTQYYAKYENTNGQTIHLSHAGFTLMQDDATPLKDDLLWDRYHIGDQCSWWPIENPNDYVVHGHTFCASRSAFAFIDTKLNKSKTVGRYCHGHKICIDGRCFLNHRIALLDLDTLTETVFYDEEQESEFAD